MALGHKHFRKITYSQCIIPIMGICMKEYSNWNIYLYHVMAPIVFIFNMNNVTTVLNHTLSVVCISPVRLSKIFGTC